jgi:putative transcriptional regulator
MSIGQDIIAGLEDAIQHAQGENTQVRETRVQVPTDIDVKAIRENLGINQEEFAIRFGFSVGAVRHWEQGRRQPEGPARAYLKVIDNNPEAVEQALAL